LRAVVAAKYPNAIHEGHGHVVLFAVIAEVTWTNAA
jgi:hypothetical protein